MPKMKTNRAAAKRFRVTGSGRVRRSKAGLNHCMQEKSRKRLRRLRKNDTVDKALEKRIKTGAHSPGMFRVRGPFSNSHEFAHDFGCPLGTPMNPENKRKITRTAATWG